MLDLDVLKEMIEDLYEYARKNLQFEEISEIKLLEKEENKKNPLADTAYYDPANKTIALYTSGRHVKDILRSLAHELIHHEQACRGHFKPSDMKTLENPKYAQEDDKLRGLEKDAYQRGNIIFRDWEALKKQNLKENGLLFEGGNAAISLIDKKLKKQKGNLKRDLEYGKIKDSDLISIFPKVSGVFPKKNDDTYIGKMIYVLGKKGLINKQYSPRFILGSTRLAALKHYGRDAVELDKYEIDDVIHSVSAKKKEYGDLDIDLVFTGDKKEIVKTIEEIDPSIYAGALVGKEISIAVRIGEKVIQVDLVDVENRPDTLKLLQYSSFVDLDKETKGIFQILFLRSFASILNLSEEEQLSSVKKFVKQNSDSDFAKNFNKKLKLGYKPDKTRFAFSDDGLRLVVDFEKVSKKDPSKLTKTKLYFDMKARHDFKDLNKFAKILLQDKKVDSAILFSAIKLAEYAAKKLSSKQKEKLWDTFVGIAQRTLRDNFYKPEFMSGIQTIAKILGKSSALKENKRCLFESREAIGRFLGKNQFSNKNLLGVLRVLVDETNSEGKKRIRLDLGKNPNVDMVEKVDSNFINFGINQNGDFFMESSNSGQVVSSNAKAKFGFSDDLLKPFIWLNKNKQFQKSLKKIYKMVGPFKYDAELFPVLTHTGDEAGNITFVATPYAKEKFGEVGSFVIFKANLFDEETRNWYRPGIEKNKELVNIIRNLSSLDNWGTKWNIYTNEADMRHNVIFDITFDELLIAYLANEENYQKAVALVSSRKKSEEKAELVASLSKVREVMQSKLDKYATRAKSVLGSGNSYIEGVVLRIKSSSGDIYEIKGTSTSFDQKKDVIWRDRTKILNLEREIENEILITLGAKTTHPAKLNKIIQQVIDESSYLQQKTPAKRKEHLIKDIIPYLFEGVDYKSAKIEVEKILEDRKTELDVIKENFSHRAHLLDPDSRRKTVIFIKNLETKILKYQKSAQSGIVPLIDSVIGRRIDARANISQELPKKSTKKKRKRVIIWTGRAQPWHKGHDAMVEKAKGYFKDLNVDAVFIVIIKGKKTSKDVSSNPLSEEEQIELISAVYNKDGQVEVSKDTLKSSFIAFVAELAIQNKLEIAGWLAGADRISSYRSQISNFNIEKFMSDHSYLPFNIEDGKIEVAMIETPRVMSGTEARNSVSKLEAETWTNLVAPKQAPRNVYYRIYDILREKMGIVDPMQEMSAMAGGAIEGGVGMNKKKKETLIRETKEFLLTERGKFLMEVREEIKFRNLVKKIIESKLEEAKKAKIEENKFRELVSKLILKEAKASSIAPHFSTGINVLKNLLKKIIPIIEIDYKQLTTNKFQRDSFRSHIVRGMERTLDRESMPGSEENEEAKSRAKSEIGFELQEQDDDESEMINFDMEEEQPEMGLDNDDNEVKFDPDDEKFIDIDVDEKEEEKPEKEEEPSSTSHDEFGIEGHDETGRNMAFQSYIKVEKDIIRTFSVLSSQEDKEMFSEYLITNAKMYFDKWEEELSSTVEEPTTREYEKRSEEEEQESEIGLGG